MSQKLDTEIAEAKSTKIESIDYLETWIRRFQKKTVSINRSQGLKRIWATTLLSLFWCDTSYCWIWNAVSRQCIATTPDDYSDRH